VTVTVLKTRTRQSLGLFRLLCGKRRQIGFSAYDLLPVVPGTIFLPLICIHLSNATLSWKAQFAALCRTTNRNNTGEGRANAMAQTS